MSLGLDDLKDDLRQEQSDLLAQMHMPSFEKKQRQQQQQQQSQKQTTANGVAAIHARTSALNAELEFHKDLLNQLMTPPGKRSSSASSLSSSSASSSSANVHSTAGARPGVVAGASGQGAKSPLGWRGYHIPSEIKHADPSTVPVRTSSPSSSVPFRPSRSASSTVGDAYGSLLHELQAVRQQVSRFVETASVSPVPNDMRVPEVRQSQLGRLQGTVKSEAGSKYNSSSSSSPPPSSSLEYRGGETSVARRSARKSRQKSMAQYRARLLEEREKIIDDLESRVSKAAMRSSRNVLRDSRMHPREIDGLHHHGRETRRKKQQVIAEECFAEVHEALKNMRADLDEEKIVAEEHLRHTFAQDKDQMIETMRQACEKEREEHIKRVVASLEESKRESIHQQRHQLNENMRREIEGMKRRLREEHTPALQVIREGALEKRVQTLAEEELKLRGQLESEMSILRGRLKAETREAVEIQRVRMIDEHRHRAESLTQDILHQHEEHLRSRRDVMTRAHQDEQETVLNELSDALSFGVRHALEEHAEALEAETAGKIERLKRESALQQANAIRGLEQKLETESQVAIQHFTNSSSAEMDLQLSRLKGELSAGHASRLHKLKLDYSGRKQQAEREVLAKFEVEYQEKAAEFEVALKRDMDENVSRLEAKFADRLTLELEARRKGAEERQALMLASAERKFHKDLDSMTKFVDNFFSGKMAESEPSSPSANERHMPTTKRAIQSRLASLSEQFETYKSRYKRATRDLASLQDEIVELRQKLRDEMRAH